MQYLKAPPHPLPPVVGLSSHLSCARPLLDYIQKGQEFHMRHFVNIILIVWLSDPQHDFAICFLNGHRLGVGWKQELVVPMGPHQLHEGPFIFIKITMIFIDIITITTITYIVNVTTIRDCHDVVCTEEHRSPCVCSEILTYEQCNQFVWWWWWWWWNKLLKLWYL